MMINADFTARAAVPAAAVDWLPSPAPGVERRMFDRVGGEVARATSIVRYAPGSRFPAHTHDGGEEFLVLDGVFQDEHGDYPAGTYVRNPPQSRHAPSSEQGCTIFVKLHQFDPADRRPVVVDTGAVRMESPARRPGVSCAPVFRDARETVRIESWEPGVQTGIRPIGGLEILCLEGCFHEGGDTFPARSWLRLPAGAPLDAVAGRDGCRVWVKQGHLRFAGEARHG
jgi:quercetin dioxygenase-like cupin family protein